MSDFKETYWSKHHTGIIQCILAGYCSVIATLTYWFPRPVSNGASQPNSGAAMSGPYVMPWYLWLGIVGLSLSVIIPAVIRMTRSRKKPVPQQASGIVPGIPTLSALLGQGSNITFDTKRFFALAYYSPITAEIEKNIKEVARQASPNDTEAFYSRFLGVGIVAYQHDETWWLIFGSQLDALADLNSRGLAPLSDLKTHYDKAAVNYPSTYSNYSFEQWLEYMKTRLLLIIRLFQQTAIGWG